MLAAWHPPTARCAGRSPAPSRRARCSTTTSIPRASCARSSTCTCARARSSARCRGPRACRSATRSIRTAAVATPARTASPGRRTSTSGSNGGEDFERRIVVKINAVERLAAELAGRAGAASTSRWARTPIPTSSARAATGSRAASSRRSATARNPFSILTKSTMILRDLDVLAGGRRAYRGARRISPSARSTRTSGA